MNRFAFELDDRERFGTKLIVYDTPLHEVGQPARSLDEWCQAIRVLSPDLVLVDCAGTGKYVLDYLRQHGINAAALPKTAAAR